MKLDHRRNFHISKVSSTNCSFPKTMSTRKTKKPGIYAILKKTTRNGGPNIAQQNREAIGMQLVQHRHTMANTAANQLHTMDMIKNANLEPMMNKPIAPRQSDPEKLTQKRPSSEATSC